MGKTANLFWGVFLSCLWLVMDFFFFLGGGGVSELNAYLAVSHTSVLRNDFSNYL